MAIDVTYTMFKGTSDLPFPVKKRDGRLDTMKVGARDTTGLAKSAAHSRATSSTTANNAAKINYAAIVLGYLLFERMNAVEGNNSVYCELQDSTGKVERSYYDGSRVHWETEPSQSGHLMVPFVTFALGKDSKMTETKGYFAKCVEEYKADACVSEQTLYLFCDAFYYEWKEFYPASKSVQSDSFFNESIIKQCIRTGTFGRFQLFDELDLTLPEIQIEKVDAASASAAATATTVVPDSAKFQQCRDGKYTLDYCWSPEQMAYIPDLSKLDGFVPNDTFYTLVDLIHMELSEVLSRMDEGEYGVNAIRENYENAILVGKPGTGKTTLANALGATFGMPVRVVAPNKHTEEDLFTGMTKVAEGGFRFCETPFLDTYKNGGILLMEEFNLGDPAVMMGALGQAIEKPFILFEDGYKEVRRHPLCVIIATMNSGTQGSREPSEAFTSRYPDTFMLDDPDENQFLAILEKNGYSKKDCKKVYRAYNKIISHLCSSSVNAKDVAMSVTLRHCLAALRQMKTGRPYKQAIRNTMIGTIAIKDLELANQTYDSVIEPMKD